MKKVLQLSGLDCANCAAELERKIASIEGISFASIAFVSQKLTLEYEREEALEKAIYIANHFEEVRVVKDAGDGRATKKSFVGADELKKRRRLWLLIAFSAVLLAIGVLLENFVDNIVGDIIRCGCYIASYSAVGYPVLLSTVKNIAKGKIFDENFLMTLASLGAVLLGETSESVLVMLLYQIGETLQAVAVASSRRSVTELMGLKSERANVFRGREQLQISPEEIEVGEILLVKAGEKVPVDGVLIDAVASLDTKSLTGEAELRTAKTGEELLSGCINAGGAFTMRATHRYEDSAAKKILDLVENAASAKAAPEKFITKFARWYTPIVCGCALALALLAPLAHGLIADNVLYFKDFARWATSALTFLVVSCPCALVISVPLTYFSGIGACAQRGILVKGATHLDTLAKAQIFAFDKTGTLTEGNFAVRGVYPTEGRTEEEVLRIAAAVEKLSAHPIAGAFARVKTPYKAEGAEERAGRGLIAKIDGASVLVGNAELLAENGVKFERKESAYTLVYVAKKGAYLGAIEVGDKLRDEAKEALDELIRLGTKRLVILTGDGEKRAQKIADELGKVEVRARLLPDEKVKKAEELKGAGTFVYVGDGINDAPVMAASDCAASMGKLGSAAAVEASDLVLISDDLKALPRCVRIAKKTRKIVLQNIAFSIAMKTAFIALGTVGVLPLWLAVFADVGVMLLAVLNSFRVRKHV